MANERTAKRCMGNSRARGKNLGSWHRAESGNAIRQLMIACGHKFQALCFFQQATRGRFSAQVCAAGIGFGVNQKLQLRGWRDVVLAFALRVGRAIARCTPKGRSRSADLTSTKPALTFRAPVGRFRSTRSSIAQLVEQVTVNHRVAGSSPARGAIPEITTGLPPRGHNPRGGIVANGHKLCAAPDRQAVNRCAARTNPFCSSALKVRQCVVGSCWCGGV